MLTKERTGDAIADLKELYKSLYALEVNGKYTDAIRIAIGVMENKHIPEVITCDMADCGMCKNGKCASHHIIINSDGFCDMYGDHE